LEHQDIFFRSEKGIEKAKKVQQEIDKLVLAQYDQLNQFFKWRFYTYLFKHDEAKWRPLSKPAAIKLFVRPKNPVVATVQDQEEVKEQQVMDDRASVDDFVDLFG
jgi:hypothetical protein